MKPVRVHITGCAPRSGTTLLMELFRSCFEIEAFGSHEISIFLKPKPEPDLYCSKRPRDVRFVRPLLRFDENLWVVFMMRDPRDVIVSEHKRRPGVYWCQLGTWKRRHQIARGLWNHPRFVVVRYEDLAQQPDATQAALQARMPFLRATQSFSNWGEVNRVSDDSEVALGGVRPISDSSIGAWKQKKGRIVSQLRKFGPIHQELIDLGYETSDGWLQSIENVAPDDSPSVLGEGTRRFPRGAQAVARSLRFHSWRIIETARYALGMSRRIDVGKP